MTFEQQRLEFIRSYLISMAADILQVSDKNARITLGAATKVLVGATFANSVMGAIGSYGIASTGTAIASLTGAAKSTAALYWIGGLAGGGVFTGSVILGAGALGASFWGTRKARKAIFGEPRHTELTGVEERIILSIGKLTETIDKSLEIASPSDKEVNLFIKIGILPLLEEIEAGLNSGIFKRMKVYRRVRFRGRINNLSRYLER